MKRIALIAIAVVCLCCGVAAQTPRPSLVEMAREHGSFSQLIQGCGPTPSLAGIVSRSDLAVRGIIKTRSSHLTPDGSSVFTDFEIEFRDVLFQTRVVAADRPGIVPPMVFTTPGGELTVESFRISVDVRSNNSRVTLKPGDEAYVFARFDRASGKWLFSATDVFSISNSTVTGAAIETLNGLDDVMFRQLVARVR